MRPLVSEITSLTIVYSTVYWVADQRKHQSSVSLIFLRGNSPVTGEFPAQRASNAGTLSIWWRHHGFEIPYNERYTQTDWRDRRTDAYAQTTSLAAIRQTTIFDRVYFIPSMDKLSHAQQGVGWNNLSIPKLQPLHRWSLGMNKEFHPTLYNGCNYLSMLELKFIHITKTGH